MSEWEVLGLVLFAIYAVGGSLSVWWWLKTNPVPDVMPIFTYPRQAPRVPAQSMTAAQFVQIRQGAYATSASAYMPGQVIRVSSPDDVQWVTA